MQVAEIAGPLLDLLVARIDRVDAVLSDAYASGSRSAITFYGRSEEDGFLDGRTYCPSEHWGDGGPLIDKYHIDLDQNKARAEQVRCRALVDKVRRPGELFERSVGFGPTPLKAAMRALVASVYGDALPDDVISWLKTVMGEGASLGEGLHVS
ncbi:phage protein NinX family protein [Duganella vulcania]|uniref:DUF2591 domain-containing protein n=1 Tax=Duganella vulcania TaxID=2692166 RepID=A0A845GE39_9BURK|nr:phage protein NinX family protein [Duganella vulcania]MYM92554.1 DUF2591 domain-containing protein [Duganella vulcania]